MDIEKITSKAELMDVLTNLKSEQFMHASSKISKVIDMEDNSTGVTIRFYIRGFATIDNGRPTVFFFVNTLADAKDSLELCKTMEDVWTFIDGRMNNMAHGRRGKKRSTIKRKRKMKGKGKGKSKNKRRKRN
jgi:hypothetical protein